MERSAAGSESIVWINIGYRHHPQLIRFRSHPKPLQAVAAFLNGLANEAERRNYRFDTTKILYTETVDTIEETDGQLLFEWTHLKEKLQKRAPILYCRFSAITMPESHPLFRIISGGIKDWEKL